MARRKDTLTEGKWSGVHSVGHTKHERSARNWKDVGDFVEERRSRRSSRTSRKTEGDSQGMEISQLTGKKYRRRDFDEDDEDYDYKTEGAEYRRQKMFIGRTYSTSKKFNIRDLVF